ncbi:MAG TPA: histidine kinase [Terriglobia bacterium]|nr:histidine kinase [Terriglobia bacterium]
MFCAVLLSVTWQGYNWYIGAVLGIAVGQAALIGILLLERSRRGRLLAERETGAQALKESEARNKAILSALPDMMFLLSEEGTYLDWYAADPSNLYAPPERFLGRNMCEIMPSDLAEEFARHFRRVVSSGEPASVDYSLLIGNQVKFFETRIVKCGDRKLLSIVRDLTEMKRAEMELQHLSSRLLSLQDDERRKIARELHDITAQNLFALTINLENLRQKNSKLTPAGIEIFEECRTLCERSLQEVRTLSYLLHPPSLDRIGLIPTLKWYIDGFTRRSGIAVSLEAAQDIGRLPEEVETDLFHVVQEGLSNVFRHSGSRSATVLIEKRADQLVLQIGDAGRGLQDWTIQPESAARLGVGIPSMKERLRRLGGHLEIESNNDGVRLVAQVPIQTRE